MGLIGGQVQRVQMVTCFRSRVSVVCVSPVYNLVGLLCRIALRAFGLCLTQRSQTKLTHGLGQTKQQKCPKIKCESSQLPLKKSTRTGLLGKHSNIQSEARQKHNTEILQYPT